MPDFLHTFADARHVIAMTPPSLMPFFNHMPLTPPAA